jgi:hypothetical protein
MRRQAKISRTTPSSYWPAAYAKMQTISTGQLGRFCARSLSDWPSNGGERSRVSYSASHAPGSRPLKMLGSPMRLWLIGARRYKVSRPECELRFSSSTAKTSAPQMLPRIWVARQRRLRISSAALASVSLRLPNDRGKVMSDHDPFDDYARRLTKRLLAPAERFPARNLLGERRTLAPEHGGRRLALEVLLGGCIAIVAIALIVALPRHAPQATRPAGPKQPVVTAPPTASPSATSSARSTISASAPLILYLEGSLADGSVELAARTYAGESAGTLVIPPSDTGYDIAPDGSKVLDGDEVIDLQGQVVTEVSGSFPQLPIWSDDSNHLCGVTYQVTGSQATGTVVEFDMHGRARTVVTLGPIPADGSAWQVLACSLSTDRAVIAQEAGTTTSVLVIRLSSGALVARHSFAGGALAVPVATHDGAMVAVDGASGIAIRDSTTWKLLGPIVQRTDPTASTLWGEALGFSWDGSRVIVDAGGASGGFHPEWVVDWASNRTVVTNTGEDPSVVGIGDAIAVPSGSVFFLPPGDVTADTSTPYFLTATGSLVRLPE